MSRITQRFTSSIGSKVLVAGTGILLALFVIGHLAGNLLVYRGQEAMNSYAEALKSLGPGLWVVRAGLLAVFALHIVTAIRLNRANRAARPVRYAHEDTIQASWASRHMVLTGLLVLAFVAMHLAHFTLGWLDPSSYALTETVHRNGADVERHDVYGMMIAGFHNDVFVALYVAAMVILGFHLSHGIGSLFQTLGFRHPTYTPVAEKASKALAWVLAVGFLLIPLTVRLGIVGPTAANG